MKKVKILGLSVLAAILLIGCGGVDEDRLAELTGNKNFEQIKQSYVTSVTMQNPEDTKIYAYWLAENGAKASPSFNFELFEKNIQNEYKKEIQKLEDSMKKIESNVNDLIQKSKSNERYRIEYRHVSQLRNLKKNYSFFAFGNAYIKDTYLPFISKQIKILDSEIDRKKKIRGH